MRTHKRWIGVLTAVGTAIGVLVAVFGLPYGGLKYTALAASTHPDAVDYHMSLDCDPAAGIQDGSGGTCTYAPGASVTVDVLIADNANQGFNISAFNWDIVNTDTSRLNPVASTPAQDASPAWDTNPDLQIVPTTGWQCNFGGAAYPISGNNPQSSGETNPPVPPYYSRIICATGIGPVVTSTEMSTAKIYYTVPANAPDGTVQLTFRDVSVGTDVGAETVHCGDSVDPNNDTKPCYGAVVTIFTPPTPAPATNTPAATATNTPTNTPAPPTNTPTATNTATNTPLPATATNTPTNTPVPPTATNTSTPTATNTSVPGATDTPVPTATNTSTNTPVVPTDTPTATNTPTNTPVPPTATNTSTPTATNTSVPGATNTPVPTATNTPTDTPTNTPVPTNTPAATATNTPAATATNTPVPPTNTPTNTPVAPTNTPVATATNTPTPSANPCASADVNGDGRVDAKDVVIVVKNLFKRHPNTIADVTHDGRVDLSDLFMVLACFERSHRH